MRTILLVWSILASVWAVKQKRDHVCYDPFGCFDTNDQHINLPQDPSVVNTHFRLYSRQHPTHAESEIGGVNWMSQLDKFTQHVDPNKKTKIIVHGFLDNGNTDWISEMTAELLKKGDFNVLVVDWGSGSKWPYEQASGNAFLVAAEVASMVEHLHQEQHVNYADVHLIGHSLGAQICGLAGAKVNKIGRISALDPADPGFTGKPTDKRLDSSDASFVDVVHTDGSAFALVQGYGMKDACGHVDFYPNGGEHQPGCDEKPASSAISSLLHGGSVSGIAQTLSCSHSRATHLYIESINSPCKFYSHSCGSFADFDAGKCLGCPNVGCSVMGYDADKSAVLGNQFLSTSNNAGYCGKEYYIEVHLSHAIRHTYGELFVTLYGTSGHSEELKFSRQMQYYQHDQAEKHVVATHTDIGTIRSVRVKFVRGSGIQAIGASHDLAIKSLIIEPAENPSSRVKFCGHNAQVHENSHYTLHSHSGC